jgi:hypothetical protein
MAHAHCMLDALGYKCIIRIRNTYFFSTAVMDRTNAPQGYVIRTSPVLFICATDNSGPTPRIKRPGREANDYDWC